MASIDRETVDKFLVQLADARQRVLADDVDESTKARAPVAATLEATIEFLRCIGVPEESRAPLLHLLSALADADSGLSNPITTKAPYVEGTPKTPVHKQAERSVAAAVVTILMRELNWRQKQAADYVSRRTGFEPQAIIQNRKDLASPAKGRGRRGQKRAPAVEVDMYRQWLEDRKTYSELSTQDFVEIMLTKRERLGVTPPMKKV